jgi:hypothetical protein
MEYVQNLQLTIFIALKQIIIYQNMFFDNDIGIAFVLDFFAFGYEFG